MKSSAFAVVFLFVALVHVCQSRLVYETAFYDADSSSPKSIVNFDGQGAANPLEAPIGNTVINCRISGDPLATLAVDYVCECEHLCKAISSCMGWVYDTNQKCSMYKSVNSLMNANNVISGSQEYKIPCATGAAMAVCGTTP